MDLSQAAQQLIEDHAKRTQHVKGLAGNISRSAYREGVSECLRLLQQHALDEEIKQKLSAPVGIQAAHSAVGGNSEVQK